MASLASEAKGGEGEIMKKVLLSDIDGTLVDSNSLHAESWRRTFEHFGIDVGLDETWSQTGKGGDQLIPVFVSARNRERLENDIKRYREDLMKREYMPRMVPFVQARDLLERVKTGGMKIVLATSAKDADLAFYKRLVGMEDLVDEEASSSDAKESKPEPDIFAAALKKAGAGPENAVALGDTPYDAEAAGKLGIPTIGLTCGGWKRSDLLRAGCIQVFRDPQHLLAEFAHSALAAEKEN
jgi:HAD superfamily hydrolase (TIGR01509 family)